MPTSQHPPARSLSAALSLNRCGALRYDDQHLLVGLGGQAPQLVGPLRESELRGVVGLGALTRNQWLAAFRRMEPELAGALRRAVTATMPADLSGLTVAVHGTGPIASAAEDLLCSLGATREPTAPELAVTVGAPGARLGTGHLRLVVELGCDQVVVGPLLRGHTGPCEMCLNLRRQDIDQHWAHLRPQAFGAGLHDDEPATVAELAHLALGLIGLTARGLVAGRPLPVGAAMSIGSPDGVLRHHLWPAHPRCDCQVARQQSA